MARKVRIELVVDASGAVKGFRDAKGALVDLEGATLDAKGRLRDVKGRFVGVGKAAKKSASQLSTFKKVLGGIAFAAVVRGAIRATEQLFEMGSRAEETASKFNTVFQDSAEVVDEFGESFANMAGLTQTEFRDLASVTGSILQGMGADMRTVVTETERITRLAADLASFHNVSIQEAFTAIRAGITGESEPLKRFGILLDETSTKTRALTDSGKENAKQLTQLEKVQARVNLIYEGAGVAVGDLERTQNSAANTARRLAAEIREQADAFAQKLLPAMQTALSTADILLSQNEEAIESWSDEISSAITEIVELVSELALATAQLKQSSIAAREANPIWDALIETWKKTNILFDVRQQIDLVKRGLNLFNKEAKEAALNQQLMNMLLSAHTEVVEDNVVVTNEQPPVIKKIKTLMGDLREEIVGLTKDLGELEAADQSELLLMLRRIDALEKELNFRRQATQLLAVPEGAPVLGPQVLDTRMDDEVFAAGEARIVQEGEKQAALRATAEAERAASEAAIQSAIATAGAQANVLKAVLGQVRTIIQARLAQAIAGAVASGSILGPIAGAAAGALMAVLFKQLMPAGHKDDADTAGAGAAGARADTASAQGAALGGIRVQDRGFTTGALGAAQSARAQQVTIRVIEPDLFRLNTELSNADGVRDQVGST